MISIRRKMGEILSKTKKVGLKEEEAKGKGIKIE
jgi:hypothetical protein